MPLFVPCHVRFFKNHVAPSCPSCCATQPCWLRSSQPWTLVAGVPVPIQNYNFCPDTCGCGANFELTFPSMGVCCKLPFFYLRVFLFAYGHWVVWNHLLSDLIVFTLGRLFQTLFYGWKRVTMSLSGGVPVLHRGHFEKSFAILHHLCRFRQCFFSLLATVVRITFTLF